MGIWGSGTFENDLAADIKDTFNTIISHGIVPSVAIQIIIELFEEELEDAKDGPLGHAALLDLAKNTNLLTDFLENEAQGLLKKVTARNWPARKKKLLKILFIKSLSAPVVQKTVKIKRVMENWEIGDTFALPLSDEICSSYELGKEYLIFRVVKEAGYTSSFGNLMAQAKITKSGILPLTSAEYDKLEYIQMAAIAYKNRYTPFASEDSLPQELRQNYQPDPWGYLPVFDFQLMESHNNNPPAKLIFLGNFQNVTVPTYSFKPYKAYPGCAWDYAEEYCLKRYHLYNLRRAVFYKDNNTDLLLKVKPESDKI